MTIKRRENYKPRGPAPCPAATIMEIHTPKLCSNRPQGAVLVTVSSFILSN